MTPPYRKIQKTMSFRANVSESRNLCIRYLLCGQSVRRPLHAVGTLVGMTSLGGGKPPPYSIFQE